MEKSLQMFLSLSLPFCQSKSPAIIENLFKNSFSEIYVGNIYSFMSVLQKEVLKREGTYAIECSQFLNC